jgi:glyoxylase-like metal-dependent hydrolase (beta-lactamase superfamily II)
MPRSGAVYLVNEDRKALIEAGPPSSANAVLDGVREVGVRPEDIEYIIVTHVHLDHAGGAGTLLKYMPKAMVVAHNKGIKHLINPQKLIEGMRQAQGEEFLAKTGEVLPVPPERVLGVYDGDVIKLSSGQTLKIIDTPGHAPHHISIFESRSGGVFSGEAAASLMADQRILLPINSPPAFNFEDFINSIKLLMKLEPSKLYYSHFGATDAVQENLELALERTLTWDRIVTEALEAGSLDGVAERMADESRDEIEIARDFKGLYEFITNNIPVCAAAHIQYHRNKRSDYPGG